MGHKTDDQQKHEPSQHRADLKNGEDLGRGAGASIPTIEPGTYAYISTKKSRIELRRRTGVIAIFWLFCWQKKWHRKQTRLQRLTHKAHFPFFKTIDEFDFS